MGKRALPKTEVKKSGYQDYKAYCTFHPSTVVMGGYQFEYRIVEDFVRFTKEQKKAPARGLPARGVKAVGFDTEYSASGELLTVGLGAGAKADALETTEKGWKKKITPIVKKAKVLIGHSVAGDLDYLVKLGLAKNSWLRGTDVRDSLLLARMYDENRGKGSYGLETLLLSEMNFSPWKAETEKLIKATGNAADWSPQQRVDRCRIDAWATAVLAEHFERKLHGTRHDGTRGDELANHRGD